MHALAVGQGIMLALKGVHSLPETSMEADVFVFLSLGSALLRLPYELYLNSSRGDI